MAFNGDIVVIVREVWDTRDLAASVLDGEGKLKQVSLGTRFDPEDLNALEMALKVKDQQGAKVTALSFGEPRNVDVLKESLYRGVDAAVRIAVPGLGALDTQTEAACISRAVKQLGKCDLLLAGMSATDGSASLLPVHVAALLGAESIAWVDALESIEAGRVVARRAIEMGYEWVEAPLPAVLAVGVALFKEDPRAPRSAKAALKLKHKKTDVPVLSAAALGLPDLESLRTTRSAGLTPIPERTITSTFVDPADDGALRALVAEMTKGE